MEKNSTLKEMTPWEKEYRRYHRNYRLIVCLSIVTIAVIWYFAGHFWGIAALLFAIWSESFYEEGATENCMDEYQYAYPKDGFRKMFKSWPYFAIMLLIAYFICQKFMPWIF